MAGSKKGDFQSVGQAIRDMLSSYRLNTKFDEANIIDSWEGIVGKPIARHTKKLSIRNTVLFVEFDSPTMRRDFSYHKQHILDLFKSKFGDGVITEIVAM